ncbi:arylesterase [Parachitinimonas caeni]|uniref:Arylesterase n=1 Tax=Parachitinimonas caeni TaxID=3031301 RepID=A0ABT7DW08_9NEIS|nr:arylesterase [Parachitinimonas caeni]MDK2124247.1 arylesterase [Parachitinimonas caeni]
MLEMRWVSGSVDFGLAIMKRLGQQSLGVICLAWALAAGATEPTQSSMTLVAAKTSHEAKILVFGDSLSAGYGIRVEQSWPALVQQQLGPKVQVINASQSGETTAGGLTRLPALLAEHKPSIVIIELGANDGLRGLPIDAARANLDRMITLSRDTGARVLLLAMRLPPNFGPAYTAKFRNMYDQLATQHKLPPPPFLLDGLADRPDQFQADQLHPTAQAQPQLVINIMPTLKRMLEPAKKKK